MIFELILWISILALLHTYLVYPLIVILASSRKVYKHSKFENYGDFPSISIILAVRNEEKIIGKKIESVLNCTYPPEKIEFLIGSDASEDNTDQIIRNLASNHQSILFERFGSRSGKVQIINSLASKASGEILVFTDAHAFFENNSLQILISNFKDSEIHVVGGRMKSYGNNAGNVKIQELSYLELEYKLKLAESILWGSMMGVFGSFYAVRKKCWKPVPKNFFCDDFYISIKAIEKGGKAIFEPTAVVYENVPGNMNEEFKRKARIATGNFQNLSVLYPILFAKRIGLSFSFFSHKVLRWFGPVFLIMIVICLGFVFYENLTYTILFVITTLSILASITDFFLKKIRIHVVFLRFIAHFFYMNLAILVGMFRFLKGVKSNVWEPTKRG